MRKRDQKIDLIQSLPPFEGATFRELRALAAAADLLEIEAGEALCRADRRAAEAFVVVDGMVDVVIRGSVVATLRRGQIVGELGVLDGQPRSADVIAATDVTVLVINGPQLQGLVATNHTMRQAILRQLAGRVRTADEELLSLSA